MIYIVILFISLLLFSLIVQFNKNKFNLKFQKIIFILFAILILASVFFLIPHKTMDLYRYIEMIKGYKYSGFSISISLSQNRLELIFYYLLYLVSKSGNYMIVPFISCFICLGCLYYIYFDFFNKKINVGESITYTLLGSLGLFFAFLPYFQIIDNLRSPIAFAFCSIAIYKQFYNNKSFISQLPLYLLAALFHTSSLITLVFTLLFTKFKKINKIRYILLFTPIMLFIFVLIFQKVSIPFLSVVVEKIIKYTGSISSQQYLFNEYTISRIAIVFFLCLMFEHSNNKNVESNNLIRYIHMFLFFCLGCSMYPEMIRRFVYLLAFFSPIILDYIYKSVNGKNLLIIKSIILFIIIGMQLWLILKIFKYSIFLLF